MTRLVLIKVDAEHCGTIPPGLIIAIPVEKVTPNSGDNVTFENPLGGFSHGQCVGFFDLVTA